MFGDISDFEDFPNFIFYFCNYIPNFVFKIFENYHISQGTEWISYE